LIFGYLQEINFIISKYIFNFEDKGTKPKCIIKADYLLTIGKFKKHTGLQFKGIQLNPPAEPHVSG
jgi:hypothetical protein